MPSSGAPSPGDERLADWLDGRMSPRELERFEAEMRVSKPLREKAEAYKQTAQSVKDAFSLAGPKVDLASRVLARIADPHGNRPGSAGAAGGAAAPIDGSGDAGPAGRVLAFPKSLPKPFLLSSLVAAAMVTLVIVLDRWQPSTTTEAAFVDALDPFAQAPAPQVPGNPEPSGSAAPGEKADVSAGVVAQRRLDADAGEWSAKEAKPEGGGAGAPDDTSRRLKDREEMLRLEEQSRSGGSESETAQAGSGEALEQKSGDAHRLGAQLPDAETKNEGVRDDVGKVQAGTLTFGMPPPIESATPRTAVPTVRLRFLDEASRARLRSAEVPAEPAAGAAKAKGVVEREQVAAKSADNGSLLAGALQLDRALGNVQVVRLPSVPKDGGSMGEAGTAVEAKDKAATGTGSASAQAWIVEGPAADVQAFLATLSEAGRARGYEIVNGEVAVTELQALDPSLPTVPGARFVPRTSAGLPSDALPSGGEDLANAAPGRAGKPPSPGAGAERSGTAGPSSPGPGGPASPGPGGPASPGPAATGGGRRGAPSPATGGAPTPNTPAAGGGGGAMLVMPVRVVVVIEPAK